MTWNTTSHGELDRTNLLSWVEHYVVALDTFRWFSLLARAEHLQEALAADNRHGWR